MCSQPFLWLLNLHGLGSPALLKGEDQKEKPDLANASLTLLPQKCSDPLVCVVPELVEVFLCVLYNPQSRAGWAGSFTATHFSVKSLNTSFNNQI